MTQRTMLAHALILGAFCLGFGMLLAFTDFLTAKEIEVRALEDRQNSLSQVIPASLYDNNPATDTTILENADHQEVTIYRARKAGQITGVAYEMRGVGYAGEIKLMLGVNPEGTLLGVRVVSHKETPGLGDRIEEKKGDWILRFTGLSLGRPPVEKWKVKKDGGQFDQFAGATITPRGVVGAIRNGLEFFGTHQKEMMGSP
ncbi:Ion-translocating oxidoreductase complex subunit G [Gammaproteobacteria bacterium]